MGMIPLFRDLDDMNHISDPRTYIVSDNTESSRSAFTRPQHNNKGAAELTSGIFLWVQAMLIVLLSIGGVTIDPQTL